MPSATNGTARNKMPTTCQLLRTNCHLHGRVRPNWWYRSSGRRGRLHVAPVTGESALLPASANSRFAVCGRCLRQPEVGAGLVEAKGTAQSWSP